MKKHSLACFHLFNDYSGSPKVLKSVLQGLLDKGCEVDLHTSRGGALDELDSPRLRRHPYAYRFAGNGAATMARYAWVQARYFFSALRYMRRPATFYINTILPVGGALAGKLMGKKVVYHYHENAFAKGAFYKALARMMQWLADDIICVSASQAAWLKPSPKIHVIPNALPADFAGRLRPSPADAFERKSVLFLGSLKAYKGYRQFVDLARELPQYRFTMVLNDTPQAVSQGLAQMQLPANIRVLPRQDDVAPFYNDASVVLNLSDKNLFVETFGLTALEAMTAGLPVIAPTAGGIAEMVHDDVNGYKIDVADLDRIRLALSRMLTDRDLYMRLAEGALAEAKNYSQQIMTDRIWEVVKS